MFGVNWMCNNVRIKAFALAEILITLVIIGIVSALSIPTLVKKYQQDAWNISADIFYQKLLEV